MYRMFLAFSYYYELVETKQRDVIRFGDSLVHLVVQKVKNVLPCVVLKCTGLFSDSVLPVCSPDHHLSPPKRLCFNASDGSSEG